MNEEVAVMEETFENLRFQHSDPPHSKAYVRVRLLRDHGPLSAGDIVLAKVTRSEVLLYWGESFPASKTSAPEMIEAERASIDEPAEYRPAWMDDDELRAWRDAALLAEIAQKNRPAKNRGQS